MPAMNVLSKFVCNNLQHTKTRRKGECVVLPTSKIRYIECFGDIDKKMDTSKSYERTLRIIEAENTKSI